MSSPHLLAVWALALAVLGLWGVNELLRVSEHEVEEIGHLVTVTGHTIELLRSQAEVLGGVNGIIDRQIVINEALINEALRARRGEKDNGSLAALRAQLADSNKRIRELEVGRGDNSEKVLAVPLLREQVDSLRRELENSVTQLRREEDQSRSTIMWGVGIGFAVLIGIPALINFVTKR